MTLIENHSEIDIMSHLKSRGLLPWHKNYFIGDDGIVYFLLFNFMGKITGIQRYNPIGTKEPQRNIKKQEYQKMKYWTVKPRFTEAVWGLDSLYLSDEIYLVEGVFDAMTLHNLNKSCISMMGNNPKDCRNALSFIRRKLIAICDGDVGGKSLKNYADEYIILPDGEDANSLSVEKLKDYL